MKRLFAPAFLFVLVACEPAGQQNEKDPTALVDQSPMSTQGWEDENKSLAGANRFNGVDMSAKPALQGDSNKDASPLASDLFRRIPSLRSLTTGTSRIIFNIDQVGMDLEKKTTLGYMFDFRFATGVGRPVHVRIEPKGITAKCGDLDAGDTLASESVDPTIAVKVDHEIRIVRTSSSVASIVFDGTVIIPNLACEPEDSGAQVRNYGYAKVGLAAAALEKDPHWSADAFNLVNTKILFKRFTVWKEAKVK